MKRGELEGAEAKGKGQQCRRHEVWDPVSEGGARTFSAAIAAAAAGVGTKNAVSFLVLTSGGDRSRGLEAFLMPFGLGTLICVALGRRPAPGRRPPLRPLTPAIEKLGEWPSRTPPNP